MFKKICIASDHAGYNLKETIKHHLINKHVSIYDLGPYKNKSVDYPDFAKKLAKRVRAKKSDIGRVWGLFWGIRKGSISQNI